MSERSTACMVMIGNELLSGRTQDQNLTVGASMLNDCGVTMMRGLVIRDEVEDIVNTVNAVRAQYDYVITSGGIGPTHDDITSACIAEAFDMPLSLNPQAMEALEHHYKNGEINDARRKMAYVPEGSILIDNPVSGAPGFQIENVFVLAGVPSIFRAMMDHVCRNVKGGAPTASEELTVWAGESTIAAWLIEVQNAYDTVEIGCYPLMRDGRFGANVVLRSADTEALAQATQACRALLERHNMPLDS